MNYANGPGVCNLFRNMVWNSWGSSDMSVTMKMGTCYCWIHNIVFNAFVYSTITTLFFFGEKKNPKGLFHIYNFFINGSQDEAPSISFQTQDTILS